MATVIVSAIHRIIDQERPTQVYRPSRPPKDAQFRKNWITMGEIRGGLTKRPNVAAQVARIRALIKKLHDEDNGSDISLIHHLRIQAMIIGIFGLNSHFSDFLDEDVLAHPGWAQLGEFSRPIADKFTSAISAFVAAKNGDDLFDQADEMFGRLRHALWCASNAKTSGWSYLQLHQ